MRLIILFTLLTGVLFSTAAFSFEYTMKGYKLEITQSAPGWVVLKCLNKTPKVSRFFPRTNVIVISNDFFHVYLDTNASRETLKSVPEFVQGGLNVENGAYYEGELDGYGFWADVTVSAEVIKSGYGPVFAEVSQFNDEVEYWCEPDRL